MKFRGSELNKRLNKKLDDYIASKRKRNLKDVAREDRETIEEVRMLKKAFEDTRQRTGQSSLEMEIESPVLSQQLSEALRLEGVSGLVAEPGTIWVSYMDGEAKQIVTTEMFINHPELLGHVLLGFWERENMLADEGLKS